MVKNIKRLLTAVALVVSIFSATSASALPISAGIPPAAVVEGENFLAMQYQNVYFSNRTTPGFDNSRANVNAWALIGGSVFDKGRISVYGILPYVNKSFGTVFVPPTTPFDVPFGFETSGLADPVIGAQYLWTKKTWDGGYMGSAFFNTWTVPLGTYNIPGIPRTFQPGGGNWIPTFGLTYLIATPKFEFYAILSYAIPFEARGYKAGNVFNYAAELGYTIFPWKFKSLTSYPVIVKAVVEFLGTLTGRIKTNNPAVDFTPENTGGNVFRVAPGLFIEWHGYALSMSYQFPVSQSVNGIQPVEQHHQIVVAFNHYW